MTRDFKITASFLVLFLLSTFLFCTPQPDQSAMSWPPQTRESRPWTYWWWPGSAVDRANITANLEDFAAAGMGGVHIIPIYGVKGQEDREVPYLSTEWMSMLAHTVSEAKRLDLGVDMTTGTGWPFGGPQVALEDAAKQVRIEEFKVSGGERLSESFENAAINAAVAFSGDGRYVDLDGNVDRSSGRIRWDVPDGDWTVYAVLMDGTGQQVKRAAPGGKGNVIDYFSTESLNTYLARFDEAFDDYTGLPVRSFYSDSYEVYGSNWTDDFFDEFTSRRGYDLRRYLPEYTGKGDSETVARVRHDYNETVSDVLLERFTRPWVEWCHRLGGKTRNQAHGSPGNLLDLYAAADIPETEAFGPSGFPIPGLRIDTNIPEHFGKPDILVQKFASSAAHVTGKPLVSSESCTWLGEHFQVSLSQVKPEIDALFVSGINHVFFHGMAYSPKEAPWPGWLFYASTNFAQSGSLWKDLPELNTYISRCQSFLQGGHPDNDVLLYWPVHDAWNKETDEDGLHHFQVHNADEWLHGTSFHNAAKTMWDKGYTFDYISDMQLLDALDVDGKITTGNCEYSTIIVPNVRLMKHETMEKLLELARSGATIIFAGSLPGDVPGLHDLDRNRERLHAHLRDVASTDSLNSGVKRASIGDGRVVIGDNLESMLEFTGIERESVADYGIEFIRRKNIDSADYFLTNLGGNGFDGWISFSRPVQSALIFDPVIGNRGNASVQAGSHGKSKVYLQLEPGQSLILKTFDSVRQFATQWQYNGDSGDSVPIEGNWTIQFIEGGPVIPESINAANLDSWTALGGENAKSFSGTARYTVRFDNPGTITDDFILDLGTVCESARVSLNGEYQGALWSFPFWMRIDSELKETGNVLEIDVTNIAANRIADLDRRGVDWKIFHDINYVTIKYKAFDASNWPPMPSGLIGPVRIIPVEYKFNRKNSSEHTSG